MRADHTRPARSYLQRVRPLKASGMQNRGRRLNRTENFISHTRDLIQRNREHDQISIGNSFAKRTLHPHAGCSSKVRIVRVPVESERDDTSLHQLECSRSTDRPESNDRYAGCLTHRSQPSRAVAISVFSSRYLTMTGAWSD